MINYFIHQVIGKLLNFKVILKKVKMKIMSLKTKEIKKKKRKESQLMSIGMKLLFKFIPVLGLKFVDLNFFQLFFLFFQKTSIFSGDKSFKFCIVLYSESVKKKKEMENGKQENPNELFLMGCN